MSVFKTCKLRFCGKEAEFFFALAVCVIKNYCGEVAALIEKCGGDAGLLLKITQLMYFKAFGFFFTLASCFLMYFREVERPISSVNYNRISLIGNRIMELHNV